MSHDCLGCRLANGLEQTQIVYENERITCILDIAPLSEGHALILPKKHFLDVDELDIETATAIMAASAKLSKALKAAYAPDGISIMQNGGQFNDLGHYHMHVFPRFEGDGFAWIEPVDADDAKGKLGETREFLARVLNSIAD